MRAWRRHFKQGAECRPWEGGSEGRLVPPHLPLLPPRVFPLRPPPSPDSGGGARTPARTRQRVSGLVARCSHQPPPSAALRARQPVRTPSGAPWTLRGFPDDARGCQCPFVLCLHSQGFLRRGVRASVLIKSRPENRGCSARGTSHMASLKFPPETGLILRCTRKAGNPFQRKQGNRPSRRDQEGIRGSEQAVHRTLVFPSSETRVSGNFCANIKVANYRFKLQDGT